MASGEGGQAQGLWEPEASASVALSCLHGVEDVALHEAGGLVFGVFGVIQGRVSTHLELE